MAKSKGASLNDHEYLGPVTLVQDVDEYVKEQDVSEQLHMDWSKNLILEFISLYEKYPVLWNPKHPNYKNRGKHHDAWMRIATEFSVDLSVEALKKKKESIMASYRSLSKKVRNSKLRCPGGNVYKPSWFAYDALDNFLRGSNRKLSYEEPTLEEYGEQHMLNDKYDIQWQVGDCDNKFIVVPKSQPDRKEVKQKKNSKGGTASFASPEITGTNKRKVFSNPVESPSIRHIKQADDTMFTVSTRSQTQTFQDEAAMYGHLLAAKLRRLSPRNQIILQNKIDNLVFEAELREMDSGHAEGQEQASPSISGCTKNESSPKPSDPSNGNINLSTVSQSNKPSILLDCHPKVVVISEHNE